MNNPTPKLNSFNGIKTGEFVRNTLINEIVKVESITNDITVGVVVFSYKEYYPEQYDKNKGIPYELKFLSSIHFEKILKHETQKTH